MAHNEIELTTDSRFEYKYRLTYPQYYAVKNSIRPFMKKDFFSCASPAGRYLVRSLYFDTLNYKNYWEKINGDYHRIKLRIRTYQNNPADTSRVRAELKTRKGIMTEKFAVWVNFADYEHFLRTRHWPNLTEPVLIEFERYLHYYALRPAIIVEYQREGYAARSRENLRITFDHKVRSTQAASLFPDSPFFRQHHRGTIVLEIKCNNNQPAWLRKLVRQNGLRIIANSKYTQGIEIARPDIVSEAWSA